MTNVIAPTTPKGRATLDRLLEAAKTVALANSGHIEIADVAREAGTVPSLVHRYFGSKAGLVCALVDDFFDRLNDQVMKPDRDAPGTWADRERARLDAGVRFHFSEPLSAVIYGQLSREPDVAAREAARIAAVIDRAARSVRKAQKAGELPVGIDPAMAGAAMFGAMRQVMVEVLARKPRPARRRVVDMLWRQVAASVGIDPVSGRPL